MILKFIKNFICVLIIVTSQNSLANETINEVLFEVKSEVWTSYDEKQFLAVYKKNPIQLDLMRFVKDDRELFVFSRLLYLQAIDYLNQLDLINQKLLDIKNQLKSEVNQKKIQSEIQKINLINSIEDFKFKDKYTLEKYLAWFGYLKRKYQFNEI